VWRQLITVSQEPATTKLIFAFSGTHIIFRMSLFSSPFDKRCRSKSANEQ
jgi:hypothetical protein